MNPAGNNNWMVVIAWAAAVVAGYPFVTIILSEITRRLASEADSDMGRFFRALQYAVLPAIVVWILLHKLTSLPSDDVAIKVVDTLVGILVLYAILLVAQAGLIALRNRTDGGHTAPKLFYELGGLVIAVIGGAFIISAVWGIELGTLFGALGVGSVVLGLALQSVIGGLANGLIVLSGRHFSIGDWLEVDGTFAKVVQVDWRSVTLDSAGMQLIVPSSKLSASTLRIRHAEQPVAVKVSLNFSSEYSPEDVKSSLLEAAAGVEQAIAGSASCNVEEYAGGGIQYGLAIAVDEPAKAADARAVLLDRVWYVRSRRGLGGSPSTEDPDAIEMRAQLLIDYGSLRGPPVALAEMAAVSRVERFATGEFLLRRGTPARTIFILVSGNLSLHIDTADGHLVVERLTSGQMFVIREIFRNAASPVDLVADCESQVIAIPAAAMHTRLSQDRKLATDLELVIEARSELINSFTAKDSVGRQSQLRVVN